MTGVMRLAMSCMNHSVVSTLDRFFAVESEVWIIEWGKLFFGLLRRLMDETHEWFSPMRCSRLIIWNAIAFYR